MTQDDSTLKDLTQETVYPTCHFILASGAICESPALKDALFCYYHSRDRQRIVNLGKARKVKRWSNPKHPEHRPIADFNAEIFESLSLPPLDDFASVQVALTNIMRAIISDHIDTFQARNLVNIVRIAEANLRNNSVRPAYKVAKGIIDPDPISDLGDDDGFVMPEEAVIKESLAEYKAKVGEYPPPESARRKQVPPSLAHKIKPTGTG